MEDTILDDKPVSTKLVSINRPVESIPESPEETKRKLLKQKESDERKKSNDRVLAAYKLGKYKNLK